LAGLAPAGQTIDADRPDESLRQICESVGIPFVPLSRHVSARDYLQQDIHWTVRGHRTVGRLVAELHRWMAGNRGAMPVRPSAVDRS
ncbi:MAG: hypothetical protein M3173_04770, partial [Chloroflexota bacterium]|nr:hypothetical protein [Chloroflexota bacterium]